ncbi:GAI protein2C [Myxococcaceae bacterium JPH2]|nr:GAI protein2C [Myxococcaceae bacterium JPH2]
MRSPKYALLIQGLEHILAGRQAEAAEALALLYTRLDVAAEPEDLHYVLFATALSKRLVGGEGVFNPYLRPDSSAGMTRQIDLFRMLVTHMPLASAADAVANTVLAGFLRGHDSATLLDVGIGQGRQMRTLLRLLAREGALPRRLTVVGVEPSGVSLGQAGAAVAEVAAEVGASVRFVPMERPVEAVDDATWAELRAVPRPLVVNAAFAMHHIAETTQRAGEARDRVLRRLHGLGPQGLVMCEPNVDHHRVPPRERFFNAWRHFTTVFHLLDSLDVPRDERAAIKRFFGREVDDIVGTVDDPERCERHETAGAWWERLRRAGFAPLKGLERLRPEGVHPAVKLRPEPGVVGITYRDESVVAVLCATPRGGLG